MIEDVLSPQNIVSNLQTDFIGQKVVYYVSLDSTMEAAKREAQWGAAAGTIVVTEEQTEGRGRLQRNWISPKGQLCFSLILRPNIDHLPIMIMISSLAVVYAIQKVTGLRAHIKWPNDILIGEKKVCGILIENDIRKNQLKHTIIGIGVNVNMNIKDYPEISNIATSLSCELDQHVSRTLLLRQILTELEQLYSSLPQEEMILEQWRKRLVTLGLRVYVNMGDRYYDGIAESVNKDGSLMLRQKDGSLVKIVAGDVNPK
jgi:BirA family transcriptional regulator, biotin operon repressor / biotin---[acetyl-CoA-carboxylase] ligase